MELSVGYSNRLANTLKSILSIESFSVGAVLGKLGPGQLGPGAQFDKNRWNLQKKIFCFQVPTVWEIIQSYPENFMKKKHF